jgi:hypothetical protein
MAYSGAYLGRQLSYAPLYLYGIVDPDVYHHAIETPIKTLFFVVFAVAVSLKQHLCQFLPHDCQFFTNFHPMFALRHA